MTKCLKDPTCGIFLKEGLFKDIKNDIPMCQTRKYKNTNTQIHKYSIWQSARKTQRVAYFWKEDCSRVSKMIIPGVKRANTKIQIQNTQIHHMVRCQKDPTCGIFLKRGLFKGIKNDNPMCQTCKNKKCKYTNKQIHHMVKCQKDPSCGIFYYAVGGWGSRVLVGGWAPVFRTKS